MRTLFVLTILHCFPTILFAQDVPETLEPIPGGAPVPPPPLSDEALEPEVTIIQRSGQTVEEYRIRGQLYMIKVSPKKGIPFYLLDTDGDGDLDSRQDELNPRMMVPHWVIFRW